MSEREKGFEDCARIGVQMGQRFKEIMGEIKTTPELDFARAHLTGNEIVSATLLAMWAEMGVENPSKGIRQALEIAENVYEADNES